MMRRRAQEQPYCLVSVTLRDMARNSPRYPLGDPVTWPPRLSRREWLMVDVVGGAILNWNLAIINLSHLTSRPIWFVWPLALWAVALTVHAAIEASAPRIGPQSAIQRAGEAPPSSSR
jgi:hypothetical protein